MQHLVLTNIPMDLSNFSFTFNTLLAKTRSTCFIHVKFCVICVADQGFDSDFNLLVTLTLHELHCGPGLVGLATNIKILTPKI